ncbi:MAG: hypothetical protein JNL28_02970 [Planctomycetes bacterium]|nr:hypothetical protein [Planctomycetota bacterium]
MRIFPAFALLCIYALAAPTASAQAVFVEVEPNGSKATATVVSCMSAGDLITGVSSGSSTILGDSTVLSPDYFRIRTCPLPPGIYRHQLSIQTAGAPGHQGTILGLDAVDLPPPTITSLEVNLQNSSAITIPARYLQWYGFGRSEELYVRITGVSTTVAPYQLILSTTPVTAAALSNVLHAGQITITTHGQGHATDTEIKIYDAALNPVVGFANDDTPLALPGGGTTFQSTLQRTFVPGSYYLLLSRFNMADNRVTGVDDAYQDGDVVDFPDLVLASSTVGGSNVSFAVTDVAGTSAIPATLPNAAYEILWYQFTVGPPWSITGYCFGNAGGFGCPCGNNGLFGNGCANSGNAFGAHLAGSGVPSVGADSFVLQGSGMPNGFVMYFQGTASVQNLFGDGILCVGGTITRLGLEANVAGASQYPTGPDQPVSIKGMTSAATGYRYQAWYRDAVVYCTPSTFNLSNGVLVYWAP